MTARFIAFGLAFIGATLGSSAGAQQDAGRNACVEHLREVGGPDARNGIDILSSEFSEAGTLVMMRDAGGSTWRCIGYTDGAIGEFRVVDAMDDGDGAMAGQRHVSDPGATHSRRVKFAPGTVGASYDGTLTPGASAKYVLGARNGQFLHVKIHHKGGKMSYQILNPDGSFLLDMTAAKTPYRGQLWQSGDHVVEVINRTHHDESYRVEFNIK
ncbi:hypothetical protein PAF17_19820 [Paracoccus sp. Z330]|uniref:Uncharacterized protein n=1 Tax=Paracoccus onchidii TaxID=3017813 RepID=A0ABT4ZK05_9RHOB|nr:hypothetical protein [Paracoccus onchidii]MDB6179699.1 hypothetical protein [Paracoccus onchidii]